MPVSPRESGYTHRLRRVKIPLDRNPEFVIVPPHYEVYRRRFYWVVPVLALGSGLLPGTADEPGSPAKGTVLILRARGNNLEGTLEGVESQRRKDRTYFIRKNKSEIVLPADTVLRLCLDWDDAYQFMKSRVKSGDADGHVHLARWCDLNNLSQWASMRRKRP